MENREFFIDKDGFKLHAKLDFPESFEGKIPVMVMIHGLTGHMEEAHLLGVVRAANKAGVATLRVEMYGHGGSDGEFKNHTVMDWVLEAIYVIDYAGNLEFASEVYLMGHSQGGLAAVLAAGLKKEQVKKLVLLSAFTSCLDFCKNGDFFGTKFDPDNVPDEIRFWGDKVITSNYLRVGRYLPVDEMIKAYKGPVLLVHGACDGAVLPECSVRNAKMYANSRLELIEGDGHCYENHQDRMEAVVYDFLKK